MRAILLLAVIAIANCTQSNVSDWDEALVMKADLPEDANKESIVRSDDDENLLVENGSAYEFAELKVPSGVSTVRLPNRFVVQREADRDTLKILLKKTLSYMGHSDTKMTIDSQRETMGIAGRRQGNRMWISTFGEWDSFEGGQTVEAVIMLPPHVSIQSHLREQGLNRSGLDQSGWHPISTYPDAKHEFEQISTAISDGLASQSEQRVVKIPPNILTTVSEGDTIEYGIVTPDLYEVTRVADDYVRIRELGSLSFRTIPLGEERRGLRVAKIRPVPKQAVLDYTILFQDP